MSIFLNLHDFPVGSRVLFHEERTDDFGAATRGPLHEAEIIEWAPSGVYIKIRVDGKEAQWVTSHWTDVGNKKYTSVERIPPTPPCPVK